MLSNSDIRFYNEISNMENDDVCPGCGYERISSICDKCGTPEADQATAEGAARLDAALAEMGESATQRLLHDVRVQAAKVEMFDELVDALAHAAGAAQSQIECNRFFSLLAKAHKLQRGEPDWSQWQPIESAPKDRSILIAGGTYWWGDGMHGDVPFTGVTIARWYDDHWRGEDNQAHDEWNHHEPTHWMPLPEPPK